MLARLQQLFRRAPLDQSRLREDEGSRLRAREESRLAEQRKSDDQRGLEGFGQRSVNRP